MGHFTESMKSLAKIIIWALDCPSFSNTTPWCKPPTSKILSLWSIYKTTTKKFILYQVGYTFYHSFQEYFPLTYYICLSFCKLPHMFVYNYSFLLIVNVSSSSNKSFKLNVTAFFFLFFFQIHITGMNV